MINKKGGESQQSDGGKNADDDGFLLLVRIHAAHDSASAGFDPTGTGVFVLLKLQSATTQPKEAAFELDKIAATGGSADARQGQMPGAADVAQEMHTGKTSENG